MSRAAAAAAARALAAMRDVVLENEEELGRIDAVAGDGDHGVGHGPRQPGRLRGRGGRRGRRRRGAGRRGGRLR